MKLLSFILSLVITIKCEGQIQKESAQFIEAKDSVYKLFDSEPIYKIDTLYSSKDSVMLIYKKSPQNIIVKGQKKYYYTGRAKIDTRIVEDTTFLAETIESYYNLKGNVVFSESQEFIRGMGYDDPCWGCSTAYLQNNTLKIYKRFIYNSINQLVLKIECSYFNNATKTTYEYDNAGNIITQKEIEISCDQFWNN